MTTILELLLGYLLGILTDPVMLAVGLVIVVVVLSGLAARLVELLGR